jgi:hypothetical protein
MDKFPMKLVIDAVSTPLLYAKLSKARSPRERAALLRSIAEAALRLQQGGVPMSPALPHGDAPGEPGTQPARRTERAAADPDSHVAPGVTAASNESESDASFNSADIADQLAAFL